MGRLLFIRVSAVTYDENKVPKAWPGLYALVWPDPYGKGAGSPAVPVQAAMGSAGRGVMELAAGVAELVRFGDLGQEACAALKPHADNLEKLLADMEKALGNRDAQTAYGLTENIEDALDQAERAL